MINSTGDVAAISAVLRSWEDRFGARLVTLGFDVLEGLDRCPILAVLVGLTRGATKWHAVAPGVIMTKVSAEHEITQRDLRSRSAEIMSAVEHGERFIVTRSGTPIGELIPLQRRHSVTREQFMAMSENAPEIDVERFRSDVDDAIDATLSDPYDR